MGADAGLAPGFIGQGGDEVGRKMFSHTPARPLSCSGGPFQLHGAAVVAATQRAACGIVECGVWGVHVERQSLAEQCSEPTDRGSADACGNFTGIMRVSLHFRGWVVLAWLGFWGALPAAAAGVGGGADLHQVPNTMAQRLMACTLCHGKEGRATNTGFFPRIAGKPEGYLYHQLRHFREGRRNNAGMTALLDHLSDAYLRDIAHHFASLDVPYPPPQPSDASAALLARGEALVRQGDAARDLPACVACHGAAMTGVRPDVPGLLGLPRDYLIGQLGGWQTGLRKAFAPDCMAHVAQKLAPEEISAVSAWLAAQALPDDPHPAPAAVEPMPLRCGIAPEVRP